MTLADMELINLTPHDVSIYAEDGLCIAHIKPSGQVARVDIEAEKVEERDGIPIYKTELTTGYGIPQPREGVSYIVSRVVKTAYPDRDDFVVPHNMIRNSKGRKIGCRGLAQ